VPDPGDEAAGGQFHFHPETYLAMVRAEVPAFDELQDTVAATCIPNDGMVSRILELGTGSGETARRVLVRHPRAALVGVDASEPMLGEARKVLDPDRVRLVVARLQVALPPGPFDVVYSALAVHHLDAVEKRDLFVRILGVLRPGGRFVLGDVVVPEDGADATTPVADDHDKPDSVADQLRWLAAAGFDARCVWSLGDLVVVSADAPGP
jgi:trans-aconitate methyltransferase